MRRALIAATYILIALAGAYLCVGFFENSARPHALLALMGAFVCVVGIYMLWIEFVSPKNAGAARRV
jgi:hypothetical protein